MSTFTTFADPEHAPGVLTTTCDWCGQSKVSPFIDRLDDFADEHNCRGAVLNDTATLGGAK